MKYKTFSSLYFKLCIRAVESSISIYERIKIKLTKRIDINKISYNPADDVLVEVLFRKVFLIIESIMQSMVNLTLLRNLL